MIVKFCYCLCCSKVSSNFMRMAMLKNTLHLLFRYTSSSYSIRTLLEEEWIIPYIVLNIWEKFCFPLVGKLERNYTPCQVVDNICIPWGFSYCQKLLIRKFFIDISINPFICLHMVHSREMICNYILGSFLVLDF